MTELEFENCGTRNNVRVVRAVILGVVAGYAVLLGLLFAFHDAPMTVLDRLGPFLIIGGVGLALSIGPIILPELQKKMPISGRGLGKNCARQAMTPQRVIGLMMMGMLLGGLLSQTVKMAFG